jgi:hypothetical protein
MIVGGDDSQGKICVGVQCNLKSSPSASEHNDSITASSGCRESGDLGIGCCRSRCRCRESPLAADNIGKPVQSVSKHDPQYFMTATRSGNDVFAVCEGIFRARWLAPSHARIMRDARLTTDTRGSFHAHLFPYLESRHTVILYKEDLADLSRLAMAATFTLHLSLLHPIICRQ